MKPSSAIYGAILCGLFFPSLLLGQGSADSTSPNIVVASGQADRTTWQELSKAAKALMSPTCNPNNSDSGRRFKLPITVGEAMGGQVKTIRVLRFAVAGKDSPVDVVRRAWTGKFQGSWCYIPWAEATLWNVAAEVEFEDGLRGVLITDGSHVALKDHDGNSWFIRLLPAAQ